MIALIATMTALAGFALAMRREPARVRVTADKRRR